MIDKNCKITIQKATNGFIAKINDNGDPFVFSTEEQVIDWFRGVITAENVLETNKTSRKGGQW